MKFLSILELRILNGEEASPTDTNCRISVGSALLILRKNGERPHTLSATSRYPRSDVPPMLDGSPLLFAGSRRGIKKEDDHDGSGYEFPLWTMDRLIYVPLWCDIVDDALVVVAEAIDGEHRAGRFPLDWEMAWGQGRTVASTSVLDVC